MGLREWVGRLDETDRKGMTAWGFIAGLVVVGILVPAIGWAIALAIAGARFIFLWGLVPYVWLGWMVPERKSHMEPEMTRAEADRALDNRVREQRLARPAQVPDLAEVNSHHRPETPR